MTEEETSGKGLSRRGFLKLAFGGSAAVFLSETLERSIYKAASLGLTSPGVTDEMVSTALRYSEKVPNSENPEFRPLQEIINEGIKKYTRKYGKKVTYFRNSSFRDKHYYADAIQDVAKASLLPTIPKDFFEKMKHKFPPEAFHAYISSDLRFAQFADLFPSGSGFFSRVRENNPDLFDKEGRIIDYTRYFDVLEETGYSEIKKTCKNVEERKEIAGNPISCSEVLELFLEENKGNLVESIYDTAIFLKFMARNNLETAEGASGIFNETWFRENIKDEYQGPSYTNLKESESAKNLVGKPYHSWNLVAMMQFFPVEMIHASGVYRQAITIKEQGLGKTRSDLQTLNDLRKVEDLLRQYSI